MIDKQLLLELLEAEYEDDAIGLLSKRGLFEEANRERWVALGKMPNNQSVVHAQQSNAAAALVEKFTNGLDAILLRHCKAAKYRSSRSLVLRPTWVRRCRSGSATSVGKRQPEIRALAEENLVLYATGSKSRPCISFYDAGEGQLPENFPMHVLLIDLRQRRRFIQGRGTVRARALQHGRHRRAPLLR